MLTSPSLCFRPLTRLLTILPLLCGLSASTLFACQVPVFRYALERWESDPYKTVCTPAADGLLPEEEVALQILRDAAAGGELQANLEIEINREGANTTGKARLELFYPEKTRDYISEVLWSGDATIENAEKMVQSPIRLELTKRILSGDSTVWLLVESGDTAKDNAAEAAMIAHLEKAAAKLELPKGIIEKDDVEKLQLMHPRDEENVLHSDVPMKIEFSVLRISRDDPAESIFLPMLLNLASDLGEYADEPMAFPVFGRGRILDPLIGESIHIENVLDYSTYLTGACSCEVKDQNPGIDLLMSLDWDAAMEGSQVIIDKILPPLEGTAALLSAENDTNHSTLSEAQADAAEEATQPATTDSEETDGNPLMPLLYILGPVIVLIGAGTVLLKKKVN